MNSKPGSELEWLFYNLWLKTGQAPPHFIFTVADTVFYRQTTTHGIPATDINIPECWYFTSKDGYILKKNRFNVSTKEIHKAFTKKMETHDQVAAVALYQEKDIIQSTTDINLQHLPTTDFRAILFYSANHHEKMTMPGS